MKKIILFVVTLVFFAMAANAAVGWRNVTYNDPARAMRAVQSYIYYPASTATINAPFSAAAGVKYPLIVVGHGFAMDYDTYKWIADSLVPAGYIVAIVNTETGFSPNHATYGLDLRFVSKVLKSMSDTGTVSPFYNRLTPKSGITGHSMGGGCSFLAVGGSTEFACATSMAAAETTTSAIAAAATITVPTLVISGTEDCVAPPVGNQNDMYNALTGCRAKCYIIDGNHCDFSQYDFNCTFGESTCNATPTISDVIQQRRTMQILRPWFNFWLKNNCTEWNVFETRMALPAYNNATFTSVIACTPIPQLNTTSPIALCNTSTTPLSLNPTCIGGTPTITYLWTPIVGLSSTTTLATTALPSTTTTYTLTATDANGCIDIATQLVNVIPTPNPTLSGSSTVCVNQNSTYSVAPIAGTNYFWTVTGGTIISGQFTATVVVQWTSTSGGTISCDQTIP